MKRLNLEGNDITDCPLAWDDSDRVELSGEEYRNMLVIPQGMVSTVVYQGKNNGLKTD